jgi:hypothetical protein
VSEQQNETSHDKQVAQLLEDVRTRVRARRAAAGDDALDERVLNEVQVAIQDVNINARVNSHLPLLWEDMIVGRLRALVQRVVRRLLRWYINPIVEQQNVYNAASAKALTLLATENARLLRELGELAARVADLEKRMEK